MIDFKDELTDLYNACLERDAGLPGARQRYEEALAATQCVLGRDEYPDARTAEDFRRHAE